MMRIWAPKSNSSSKKKSRDEEIPQVNPFSLSDTYPELNKLEFFKGSHFVDFFISNTFRLNNRKEVKKLKIGNFSQQVEVKMEIKNLSDYKDFVQKQMEQIKTNLNWYEWVSLLVRFQFYSKVAIVKKMIMVEEIKRELSLPEVTDHDSVEQILREVIEYLFLFDNKKNVYLNQSHTRQWLEPNEEKKQILDEVIFGILNYILNCSYSIEREVYKDHKRAAIYMHYEDAGLPHAFNYLEMISVFYQEGIKNNDTNDLVFLRLLYTYTVLTEEEELQLKKRVYSQLKVVLEKRKEEILLLIINHLLELFPNHSLNRKEKLLCMKEISAFLRRENYKHDEDSEFYKYEGSMRDIVNRKIFNPNMNLEKEELTRPSFVFKN